jgi:Transposase C of IS166 homeodomain
MTVEEQAATLRPHEIVALLVQQRELQDQNAALKRQVEWFQRQLFGRKSERRLREPDPHQLSLSGMLTPPVLSGVGILRGKRHLDRYSQNVILDDPRPRFRDEAAQREAMVIEKRHQD